MRARGDVIVGAGCRKVFCNPGGCDSVSLFLGYGEKKGSEKSGKTLCVGGA